MGRSDKNLDRRPVTTTARDLNARVENQTSTSAKNSWENIVLHYLAKLKNYCFGGKKTSDGAQLRKALSTPPRSAQCPSQVRHVVEQALQYGITHGVVRQRGVTYEVVSTPNHEESSGDFTSLPASANTHDWDSACSASPRLPSDDEEFDEDLYQFIRSCDGERSREDIAQPGCSKSSSNCSR